MTTDPITPAENARFWENQNFDYRFLRGKQERITTVVALTAAATAANYEVFWVAPADCVLVAAYEAHKVAGSDAGAVTLTLERLSNGVALDSGVAMLDGTFDLKGTANTYQEKFPVSTFTSSLADRAIPKGARVALKDSGTLTAVSHVVLTMVVQYTL